MSKSREMLVTGGGGGLGKAIVTLFRGLGWHVHATSRAEIDVCSREQVERYFSENVTPACELVIHAAGITRDQLLARTSALDWQDVWNTHVVGAQNLARSVEPIFKKNGGHLILVSSFSAWSPPLGQVAYATAKAAILGLCHDLARNWGSNGIRVNAIIPGFLETKMTESVSETRKTEILAQHVLGILNTSENVANFIHFLHESLPYTSGQIFNLDSRLGGL